ncbi:hypothetical protein JTE90_021237 [Oedothorax gibbosus]|uniref:NF-X1-type zinc finger protein NFXL1 n=1 Tax=Oedothorax gibbosus TaxID=931172 RepID=A0AAV6UXK9_9ARAC|nr:hypothetical protein JTE90_021237 [Oedothorax gibbosus]
MIRLSSPKQIGCKRETALTRKNNLSPNDGECWAIGEPFLLNGDITFFASNDTHILSVSWAYLDSLVHNNLSLMPKEVHESAKRNKMDKSVAAQRVILPIYKQHLFPKSDAFILSNYFVCKGNLTEMNRSKTTKGSRPKGPEAAVSQSQRFQEACEAMKKNAARFMEAELSSDSSEEEIDEAEVVKKTLSNYAEDESQNLRKIREVLQDVLTSGALVCLICIEAVKRNDKVWSCGECFCMFHLQCIQMWAKDSMHRLDDKQDIHWRCPKCRCAYAPSLRPSSYVCFCGKVQDPPSSQWGVPHACEGRCDRRLKPDCGHTCVLLCHPGPCPPCPQTVLAGCCCGKGAQVSRRCSHREWCCGKPCGKELACGTHACQEACHSGACPPCQKQSLQRCACGSTSLLRPCQESAFQCGRVCAKPLHCGHHTCQLVCHAGPCPDCPDSGLRTCPCGKKTEVRPCTERVDPCGDTCGKELECGIHGCGRRCHVGPCEQCLQMRLVKCRCGAREKQVACGRELCCDTKCRNRRDCGRHNCSRKCCVGNCPPCELPCGRTLNCGKHKCTSLCHSGPCYPCHEMAEVACNCGLTKISVPCGRKKTALPPRCTSDCKLPPECHHPSRHRHKCHFGRCPPCRLTCGKFLPPCAHTCPARCHSAVLTKVDTKEKKAGPWDLKNSSRMELVCKPCPPCMVPVPVTCTGGHETAPLPCSGAVSTSCGRPCGRSLPCTNHTCTLQCHPVKDPADPVKVDDSCASCREPCGIPRPPGCPHPCSLPCHPAGRCRKCREHLRMRCHCGLGAIHNSCGDWTAMDAQGQKEALSCKNRCPKEMPCGHRCPLTCHPGACAPQSDCKKKVAQRCPCKRRKREVPCNTLTQERGSLECDAECSAALLAQRKAEREEALRREQAAKEEQAREVEAFLKKAEGKKRRRRDRGPTEEEAGWGRALWAAAITVGALAVAGAVYLTLT